VDRHPIRWLLVMAVLSAVLAWYLVAWGQDVYVVAWDAPPRCFVDDTAGLEVPAELLPRAAAVSGPRTVRLAFDTDPALAGKFPDHTAEEAYLGALFQRLAGAYAESNVQVISAGTIVRPRTDPDPYPATDPGTQLVQLRTAWLTTPLLSTDAVQLVSGKPVRGGIAYVGSLCSDFAFSVAQVYGTLASPWDGIVTTHEFGHTLGSPHSHCYEPPMDRCWTAEQGCYAGPVVCGRGTIMSYCHVNCGGLGVLDFLLGVPVVDRINTRLAQTPCLGPGTPTTTLPPGVTTTTTSSTTTTRPFEGDDCRRARTVAGRVCAPPVQFPRRCAHAQGRVRATCRPFTP